MTIPFNTTSDGHLYDTAEILWKDGAVEPGSSGSGVFTFAGGELLVMGVAAKGDNFGSYCPSGTHVGYFSKVKNSYPYYRAHLEPTSKISVPLTGPAISDAAEIQLHSESGALVSGTATISAITIFPNVPTGRYYVDVYGWDMRIATSTATTVHDRNACTGGDFDCRTIASNVALDSKTKQPLYITVQDSANGAVPSANVRLDSWNNQTGVWTQRAVSNSNASGVATFQAWPTTLQPERYRVSVSTPLGAATREDIKVNESSGGNYTLVLPTAGTVAAQTPTISSVTTTAPNSCDLTNASRGWITITGSNFTSSSVITLSDGTTNYAIPGNRTTVLSASQIRACANVYYTPNWNASVTNGGTASNAFAFVVNTNTGVSCSPSFAASTANFAAAANTGSVDVLAGSSCTWTASSSNTTWLTISQGTGGTGNGRVYYSITGNSAAARSANINLSSSALLTVNQSAVTVVGGPANCTYSVYPTTLPTISSTGGNITFSVSTQAGCTWTAATDTPWAIPSTTFFSGSGTTAVALSTNSESTTRYANAFVAGQSIPFNQAGTVVPTSGSIQIFIDPPDAITAGGQWASADVGGYQNSGATVSGFAIPSTRCLIVKPIPNWTTLNAPCFTLTTSNPSVSTNLTAYRLNPVVLASVSVFAPYAVFAGQTVEIKADASWSNSTSEYISPIWTVSDPSVLIDRGGGFFSIPSTLSSDVLVTITASYTSGGITRTDTRKVAVLKRFVSSEAKIAQGQTRKLATGQDHSVAVRDDGTVWAWGSNTVGQLGNGSQVNSATPVQVIGLSDVQAVEAAGRSSFALKSDGTLWAWGFNGNGELGDGTLIDRPTPVRVLNMTDVKSVCGSGPVNFAVKTDGTLWGWGNTSAYYQVLLLGPNPSDYWSPPVQLTQLGTDVAEACPTVIGAIAVKSNGSAYRWGVWQRYTPQEERITTPALLTGFEGAGSISALYNNASAATANGDLRVYGLSSPVLVTYYSGRAERNVSPAEKNFGFEGVAAVSIANGAGTVLLNDGRVVGVGSYWGPNLQVDQFVPDQVGRFVPGQIAYYVPTVYSNLNNIVSLPRLQSQHGLALRQDGCVMSWGYNGSGQTGQGSITSSYSPVTNVVDPLGGCFKLSNPLQITATPSTAAFGSVTGAGTYPQFQPVRVSATPSAGYAFNGWTENSAIVSNVADYDFTVMSSRNLIASFGCDYKLGSYINGFLRPGGTSSPISVTTGSSCTWSPVSTTPWVQVQSPGSTGNGALTFSVQPNATGYARTGTVTVGSQSVLVMQAAGCSLDINGDSQVAAGSDGVLLIRYLLGFRGSALVDGINLGSRNTSQLVEDFIGSGNQFDVFGRTDGSTAATADGLVLTRLMLGISDTALLNGVTVPAGAQYASASAIRTNVNVQCGTLY